ncbi:hypothetical protein BS47DRAFT_1402913 [Hydnum rufescens UP504]|uniref:Uncharacterized protein n=1 Tax=Hydnum rufescens UP504 TaxID=1448309 RepID=A0A9P6DLC9_9AGAM|nr:hypothetical protein BS47DRAFT_1402913 [Hydnum rufescens UP504]
MSTLLDVIHENIGVFITNGSRGDMSHLNIPKLYALPRSIDNARYNGVSINFTTETAKSLHIPMCKDLYNATNRHQYEIQMLHLLDMHEKIHFWSAYLSWDQQQGTVTIQDNESEHLGHDYSDSEDSDPPDPKKTIAVV